MSDEPFEFSEDWTGPFQRRKHRKRLRTVSAVLVLLGSIAVLLFFALAFSGLSRPAPPPSNAFTAQVVRIVDGDTVDILQNNMTQRVRLYGIDCPEGGQPFGQTAKQFFAKAIGAKTVQVEKIDVDRYGHTIAEVFSDGESINAAIVEAGLAWHDVKDAPDRDDLAAAEQRARNDKLGLWAESSDPIPPWDWRKLSKEERDTLR